MPITYAPGGYRIRCIDCNAGVRVNRREDFYDRFAQSALDGMRVEELFRWNGRNFQNRCHDCRRAHDRAARADRSRRTTRVPGTTSAMRRRGINRPFGVELEIITRLGATGINAKLVEAGVPTGVGGWQVKYDGSIGSAGVEVVSPPLHGEDGEEQVRKVCRALRAAGATVDRRCGTHVHHDARDLTVEAMKALARGWAKHQPLIDGLVSPSRRNGQNQYCARLTQRDLAVIETATSLSEMQTLRVNRYRTLNLTSYGRHGTVEIRQHQGTIDPEKIISWVRFGQAMIDTAIEAPEMAAPVATRPADTMRNLFARLGDRMDETARTFLLGRALEFGAVAV